MWNQSKNAAASCESPFDAASACRDHAAGDLPMVESGAMRKTFGLTLGGDDQVAPLRLVLACIVEQHFAFELGGQPARHDFDQIGLRIAEIALGVAENPQRAQRRGGAGDRHADRRARRLGRMPIADHVGIGQDNGVAQQGFEIAERAGQIASGLEQLAFRAGPKRHAFSNVVVAASSR